MPKRGCEKEYPSGPGDLSPRIYLERNSFEGQPEKRGRNTKATRALPTGHKASVPGVGLTTPHKHFQANSLVSVDGHAVPYAPMHEGQRAPSP